LKSNTRKIAKKVPISTVLFTRIGQCLTINSGKQILRIETLIRPKAITKNLHIECIIKAIFLNLDSFNIDRKKETISMHTSIEIIDFIPTIKGPFSMKIMITTMRVKDGKTMSSNNIQELLMILKREVEENGKKRDAILIVICITELLFIINC
jgi:hypothetical protein